MRGRVAEDAELLEYASHVLYGEGGVSSSLGGIYADVLCWRYLMACTWSVTALANHMDERTAKVYADSALASVDSSGILETMQEIVGDRT